MSEIKLKPCPFCGDEKDLQILNTGDLVGWTCHYDNVISKWTLFQN